MTPEHRPQRHVRPLGGGRINAIRALVLGVVLSGCGHDVTAIDMMFVAQGNANQLVTHQPWGPQQRIVVGDHAVHPFARLNEYYADATTFDAERVARIRGGQESLEVPLEFEVWSGVEGNATQLPAKVSNLSVRQNGERRMCRLSPGSTWTCPLRYADFEIVVGYGVLGASGELGTYELVVQMQPTHLRHEVNNSIALIIGGA